MTSDQRKAWEAAIQKAYHDGKADGARHQRAHAREASPLTEQVLVWVLSRYIDGEAQMITAYLTYREAMDAMNDLNRDGGGSAIVTELPIGEPHPIPRPQRPGQRSQLPYRPMYPRGPAKAAAT